MDTDTALSVLVRRWRIALAGLLLTLLGAIYIIMSLGPIYKATGSLVLVAPPLPKAAAQATGNIGAENPLLGFSNALNIDANLVIRGLTDPTQVAAILSKGGTATYALAGSVDGITPLINVTASSSHPAAAEQTAKVVMSAAQALLAHRQAAVQAPADTLIHADVLTAPSQVTKSWSGRLKDLIVVILAGTIGTYLLALGRDRMASSRSTAPETQGVLSDQGAVAVGPPRSEVKLDHEGSTNSEFAAEEPMNWISEFGEDVARATADMSVGMTNHGGQGPSADSHSRSQPAQRSPDGHRGPPA